MEIPPKKEYLQPAGIDVRPVISSEVAEAGVTSTLPFVPSVAAQAVGVRQVGAEIPTPSQLEELTLSIGGEGIRKLLKEPITAAGYWLGVLVKRLTEKNKLREAYAG